jgi:hypothetical protein
VLHPKEIEALGTFDSGSSSALTSAQQTSCQLPSPM